LGRPAIRKSGPMTPSERQRKWRRKVARIAKLADPRRVAKRERRAAHVKLISEQQALASIARGLGRCLYPVWLFTL
jgi:hypothetical protein